VYERGQGRRRQGRAVQKSIRRLTERSANLLRVVCYGCRYFFFLLATVNSFSKPKPLTGVLVPEHTRGPR